MTKKIRGRVLNFKKEYKDVILSGKKTMTIRLKTDLKVGDLAYIVAGGDKLGIAEIIHIAKKRLSDLTHSDAEADGFDSLHGLIRALKRHYKDVRPDTELFVIRFKLRGRD